ncbi:MAG: hypothetical protein J5919_06355 [Clostridia bacterium]|nr:hypothetical protein [Clostridia bacterium]
MKKSAGQIRGKAGSADRRAAAKKLLVLALAVTVSSAVYFWAITLEKYWKTAVIAYLVAASVVIIAYFIVNRGLTENNITPEMISDELSAEEKAGLIERAAERKKKTSWMLVLFIAIITPVMIDLLRLFVFSRLFDLSGS